MKDIRLNFILWDHAMFKKGLLIVLVVLVAAVFLNVGFYFVYPDVSKLKKVSPKKTAFMEYRENEWERQGKKRKIIRQWRPCRRFPLM
jgi:monofunctional biosynthetic peptidoglycan transglycosylase